MLELWGRIVHRHRWLTLALTGVFLALSAIALARGGSLSSGDIHDLEASRAQALVERVLGHPAETTFVAVLRDDDATPGTDAFRSARDAALASVRTDARVDTVVTSDSAPTFMRAGLVDADRREELVLITLRGDFKEALASYPAVRAELGGAGVVVTATGHVPFVSDMNHTLEKDLLRAELISLPLALLVLLVVFRSAVAAVLPIGVGALAVVGGIAVVLGLSHHVDLAEYTVNVCSLIGLGLAIDYSLFTVSRYREELARGHGYEDALARTLGSAGRVVLFSGLAVATGLTGLLFFRGSYLAGMGVGGIIVVALAVVFALTFLPALLAVLGARIHRGRLPLLAETPSNGIWRRVAHAVMRRPVRVLVPTLGALVLMATPALHLRLSAADVRVLGAEVEARRGFELLQRDFPDQAKMRVVVAVEFPTSPALTEDRVDALYDLSARLKTIAHVEKVESLVDADPAFDKATYRSLLVHPPALLAPTIASAERLLSSDRVVLLYAVTDARPDSDEARDVVRAIRADRQVGDGTLLVGGQIAKDLDVTRFVGERAPFAALFIVLVTLVILYRLLDSVLLPVKAVLMNFLSIAASFGALVWIFQDGHLFVSDGRPLEPALPILLFCVMFGLSMDYEVLMLSRIKEAYDATGDDRGSVAEGLERSAGLITSAAAIMVVVFAAFALAKIVVIQAMGVGMALAVAIDATLVRVLLVPSTMRLFGRLNWWSPRFGQGPSGESRPLTGERAPAGR